MPGDDRDDDLPVFLSYACIIQANLNDVNVKRAVRLLAGRAIFGAVTDCVEESRSLKQNKFATGQAKVKSPVGKSKVVEIFSKTYDIRLDL